MRGRIPLIVIGVVLLVGIGAAWALQALVPSKGVPYHVTVSQDDRAVASYDLAALQALGVKQVIADGKKQSGPTLASVLAKAGVTGYTQVEIIGPGTDDSGHLILQRASITSDVLLAVSNRGTVKVTSPNIPKDKWVRDVTELVVQ